MNEPDWFVYEDYCRIFFDNKIVSLNDIRKTLGLKNLQYIIAGDSLYVSTETYGNIKWGTIPSYFHPLLFVEVSYRDGKNRKQIEKVRISSVFSGRNGQKVYPTPFKSLFE
jgi:hypothetical protein